MTVDRIRFHCDEHIDPDIAEALRRHGIDITTTADAGLLGADDPAQMAYAQSQLRILVTDDADFLRWAASAHDHPGIVVCHRELHTTREIIRGLILIYEVLTAQEMAGRFEYI
jgi:predicted nuclease of predicted toxin-antitoxin system